MAHHSALKPQGHIRIPPHQVRGARGPLCMIRASLGCHREAGACRRPSSTPGYSTDVPPPACGCRQTCCLAKSAPTAGWRAPHSGCASVHAVVAPPLQPPPSLLLTSPAFVPRPSTSGSIASPAPALTTTPPPAAAARHCEQQPVWAAGDGAGGGAARGCRRHQRRALPALPRVWAQAGAQGQRVVLHQGAEPAGLVAAAALHTMCPVSWGQEGWGLCSVPEGASMCPRRWRR